MLDFEEEMKAVKKGYVVLSIEEYDSLRDQIAATKKRAAEMAAEHERDIEDLMDIVKRNYGGKEIYIEFNVRRIHELAVRHLHKHFSAEELKGYSIKSANDMYIMDELLARPHDSDTDDE